MGSTKVIESCQLNARITSDADELLSNYENSLKSRTEFRYLTRDNKNWPGNKQLIVNAMVHAFLSKDKDERDEIVRTYIRALWEGKERHPLIRPAVPPDEPEPPIVTGGKLAPHPGVQSERPKRARRA